MKVYVLGYLGIIGHYFMTIMGIGKTATPDYIMAMKIVYGNKEDIKIAKELISRIREIRDIKTVMFYINKYYDMNQVDKEVFSQIQKWMS